MAKSAAAEFMAEDSIGGKIKSWPQRVKGFYQDVRTEMKKVWSPSLKEVQANTIVVLIAVALFAFYFWVIDGVINYGMTALLHAFKH